MKLKLPYPIDWISNEGLSVAISYHPYPIDWIGMFHAWLGSFNLAVRLIIKPRRPFLVSPSTL